MTITITAFERSPDGGKGMARDMRVRWALEEVGQPYDVRPVSFAAMKAPAHRSIQPFGQIPTFEDGDVALFESGAIVLHVATCHAGLLPADPAARARAISWMFAAVGTVEPVITDREAAEYLEHEEPWFAAAAAGRRGSHPRQADRPFPPARRRGLARRGLQRGRPDDGRRAAQARRIGPARGAPESRAYVGRAEGRPAFRRAFDAQRAFFDAHRAASQQLPRHRSG